MLCFEVWLTPAAAPWTAVPTGEEGPRLGADSAVGMQSALLGPFRAHLFFRSRLHLVPPLPRKKSLLMSKWTPTDDQLLLSLTKGPPTLGWQEITRVYNDSRTDSAVERTTRALKDRERLLRKRQREGNGHSLLLVPRILC
jgi:hypothetical protein